MAPTPLLGATSLDVIGGYFLLVFLVATGVLDSLRSRYTFATCEGDAAYDNATITSAVLAGLSGGCFLVLLVTMFGSPTSRRWPIRAAAWAFATCVVHYAFNTSHASLFVCVQALGGYSASLRPQQPMELAFWFCTLVPEVWAVACLARQPLFVRIRLIVGIVVLLASGFTSTFTDVFALWIAMLITSSIAHVGVTIVVFFLFRAAHAQSKDEFTRQLVACTAPLLAVVWCAYPAWWLAAQFSLMTPSAELIGWRLITFAAKFALASLLMCGNFIEQAKLIEDELAVFEDQRRRAEGRDEAKRLFVRYILHEIRVPLQGGQLAIQELQLGLDAGEIIAAPSLADTEGASGSTHDITPFRSAVDTAAASISTVGKLLDDFLSLAKIEDGRMTFESSDVLLEGLLREATSVFTNALRAKGLQLRLSLSPDSPATVFVDGPRVRQIVSNFLSNAIKFSPQGGEIVVRVRRVLRAPTVVLGADAATPDHSLGSILHTTADPSGSVSEAGSCLHHGMRHGPADAISDEHGSAISGDDSSPGRLGLQQYARRLSLGEWTTHFHRKFSASAGPTVPFLRVSVSDNGPGIPSDEIPLLFQPYSQLHAGVQQKGLGTGLGLAICKGIAELMGGAVGVSSHRGPGATFWVEVPLSPHALMCSTPARSVPEAPAGPPPIHDNHGAGVGRTLAFPQEVISAAVQVESSSVDVTVRGISYSSSAATNNVHSDTARSAPSKGSSNTQGTSLQSIVVDVDHGTERVLPSADGTIEPRCGAEDIRIVSRAVVVDDVRSNRELFARLLRRAGVDVVFTAENGLDALIQLRSSIAGASSSSAGEATFSVSDAYSSPPPPDYQLDGALGDALVDVWFVDGNMPVMDGLELARRLRTAGVRAPLIAVTGNALAEDQAAFRIAGADAVLTKPLTASKLVHGLSRIGLGLPRMPLALPEKQSPFTGVIFKT